MRKTSFHTHTTRCHHAYGSDEEYIKAAIEGGFDVIGISDHTPWNYKNNFKSRVRMTVDEFDDYYNSINALKEKYKDQIEILIGLEAEYFPEYMDWYKQFIKEKKLDYVIFGNHYHRDDVTGEYYGYACQDDKMLYEYAKDVKKGLETGIYSYLAHPDLFMRGRNNFDDVAKEVSYDICKTCKELDIPLEYNLAGMEASERNKRIEYPYPDFWKIASEVGNKVIIGVDAHSPRALSDDTYFKRAEKEIAELGLERVDMIDINKF